MSAVGCCSVLWTNNGIVNEASKSHLQHSHCWMDEKVDALKIRCQQVNPIAQKQHNWPGRVNVHSNM